MAWNGTPQIPTPPGSQNNANGPNIMLAPAVVVVQEGGNTVSADFVGTFPEQWQGSPEANGKYPFGDVSLQVTGGGSSAVIGPVPYIGVDGGNACGWVFDFDISTNTAVQEALQDPKAAFSLVHETLGPVLAETDYYIVSNQQAIYAEQNANGITTAPDMFLNQGTLEPATISVFHRGVALGADGCPPITVWAYQATPIQSPGNVVVVAENFAPGQNIVADLSQPGNVLFTFTVNDPANPPVPPPQSYNTFEFPPWVTNAPSISLRILPNDKDFSQYYVGPTAESPLGNHQLTFDVLYTNVLQTYYLLCPAMKPALDLSSEVAVLNMTDAILQRTDVSQWMTAAYMPRTRDLSASRKQLLQAYCRAHPQSS